ncbi:NrsF family protein [Caulobacter sp. DWR1-3-2b1]|uniref:NrsF family protein n=1 Tax=Caulobacter sp. DWR1-3-2b1 TaxID=2804670 RepID=UPI003CED8DA6
MTIDDVLVLPDEAPAAAPGWSTATLHKRLLEIAAAGALAAVLLVLVWLHPRADFWVAIGQPFFWLKVLYTVALAAVALGGATAVARPGVSMRPALATGAAVVAVMALAAAFEAPSLDAAMLTHVFDPAGALACAAYVAILSAPMLLIAGIGLRGIELERPAATGLFVGLFSGAVAASVYGVHCHGSTFLFVALSYTAAILLCGAVGAVGLKLISRRPLPDLAIGE